MSRTAKASKLATLAANKVWRRGISRRVFAAIEHREALAFCKPASVLDIGANRGQFSLAVRGLYPDTVIHAFEPLPDAADRYAQVFAGDAMTTLHRVALGSQSCEAEFFVASRDDSSSLLKPGAGQLDAYGVGLASSIRVRVEPLTTLVDVTALPAPRLMKIDVQGAELQVLQGCDALDAIDYLLIELSFVELYEHQALFRDVEAYLATRGWELRGIFNQSMTPSFGPTQADFLFVNGKRSRAG